jgi:prevent-host-death family protein
LKARVVDLRYRMKSVLEALDRGEPVTISHHGREKARLVPVQLTRETHKPSSDPAFGLWKDRQDLADVPGQVRRLRSSRLIDL